LRIEEGIEVQERVRDCVRVLFHGARNDSFWVTTDLKKVSGIGKNVG